VLVEVVGGDRFGAQRADTRDQEVPVGGARPGGVSALQPRQQDRAGEVPEGLGVAGDGDPPAGQVDVVEGEFADRFRPGGVDRGKGHHQALRGADGACWTAWIS